MSEIDKTKIKANSRDVEDYLEAVFKEAADRDEHVDVTTYELDDEDKGLKVLRENLGRAIREAKETGQTLPRVLAYWVKSKEIETLEYETILDDIPCGYSWAALIEFKRQKELAAILDEAIRQIDAELQATLDEAIEHGDKGEERDFFFEEDETALERFKADLPATLERAQNNRCTLPFVVGVPAGTYDAKIFRGLEALKGIDPSAFRYAVLVEFKRFN